MPALATGVVALVALTGCGPRTAPQAQPVAAVASSPAAPSESAAPPGGDGATTPPATTAPAPSPSATPSPAEAEGQCVRTPGTLPAATVTVRNGDCVDVHEGDRMQVVDARGVLVAGHRDSFEVGCSHSWTSRIVWDPRTSRFVMVCATDNGCRIAQPNPYRTVAPGTCDGTLFGGDLVLARTAGYWTAWSQGGKARLEHFTTGAADRTVSTSAATRHPHLVGYGADRMLLTWQEGSGMAAQVHDAASGEAVGAKFTIAVPDQDYQAFKPYPDGSAAYPAAGGDNTTVRIARVLPMS